MMEITKENCNFGKTVDKCYKKSVITAENETLRYLFGAFFIFAVANATLIYNFFKILNNLM